jgi:hypothetical protein
MGDLHSVDRLDAIWHIHHGRVTKGVFSSQATNNSKDIGINGTSDFAFGNVSLPAGRSSVPEPASAALLSSGLIGLALVRRRFARQYRELRQLAPPGGTPRRLKFSLETAE